MTIDKQTAEDKAKNIKLLILDVDGVLTEGRIFFSEQGEALKVFNTLDGQGIKMLRASGVEVAVISGRRSPALTKRLSDLSIEHVFQGREDKLNALDELLSVLKLEYSQIAHMGDDLPDLPVMRRVGLGLAVPNAYRLIKEHADWCSQAGGGCGAVREACDFIMSSQGTLEPALSQYL